MTTSIVRSIIGCLVLLLSACGGSAAAGSANVTGNVNGAPFVVTTAFSAVVSDSKGASGFIALTNDVGLCGQLASASTAKSQQRIAIFVFTIDASKMSHAATATGDYSLDPSAASGLYAELDYRTEDASCQQVVAKSGKASAGTVHISSIQGNVFTGTFDVTLSTSEHVTGSFGSTAAQCRSCSMAPR